MKIGVFDSGIGGLSMANAIAAALPQHQVSCVNDAKNVPYGDKSPDQLFALVLPILQRMQADGCAVIVVACNTVSTTILPQLRGALRVPLVAVEPMVKPAATATKSGVIAVCATPTTLASQRYAQLKHDYAADIMVLEPDCSDWSRMIEAHDIDHQQVRQRIIDTCEQSADVIVLGCTHYHWIEEEIAEVAQQFGALVIQPEQAIVSRLKQVISRLP